MRHCDLRQATPHYCTVYILHQPPSCSVVVHTSYLCHPSPTFHITLFLYHSTNHTHLVSTPLPPHHLTALLPHPPETHPPPPSGRACAPTSTPSWTSPPSTRAAASGTRAGSGAPRRTQTRTWRPGTVQGKCKGKVKGKGTTKVRWYGSSAVS